MAERHAAGGSNRARVEDLELGQDHHFVSLPTSRDRTPADPSLLDHADEGVADALRVLGDHVVVGLVRFE
jgi:hypothetical protein